MTKLVRSVIRAAILLSQRAPAFRSRGSYSTPLPSGEGEGERMAAAEYLDSANLLSTLPGFDLEGCIRGRVVLDFGSGYGGRSVWYAERAAFVEGVDVYPSMLELSTEFARSKGSANVRFTLGSQDRLDFPADHFDVIISFDVLEHVGRPDVMISELHRVLKRGGKAILIFTPYYGMFSHHLNYITLLPGIHWIFPARDLVGAVNELLETDRFRGLMARQPEAQPSFNGRRVCLPGLNGLRKREYVELVRAAGFEIEELRSTPILEKFRAFGRVGAVANRALNRIPGLDEYLSHNLVSILAKP